jgi:hypothetical protein
MAGAVGAYKARRATAILYDDRANFIAGSLPADATRWGTVSANLAVVGLGLVVVALGLALHHLTSARPD